MKKARFFKKRDKGSLQCTACEWNCVVGKGESGICGVRINKAGTLYSVVYGHANDAYADWIEKKKLAHVLPGTMAFSIGTIGCNFGCDYCCNWETSQGSKIIRERLRSEGRVKELTEHLSKVGYKLSPREVVDYCKKKDYKTIAYTYNEPTVFIEYALDIAKAGRKKGIKSVFVTNGFMTKDVVSEVSKNMDAVAIDIKSITTEFYRKHCKAKVDPVLRNIELFAKKRIWIELTTLVIPGENDTDKEIRKIASFIAKINPEIPWHITQFSPDYKLLDKPRTPSSTLYRAFDIAKDEGLTFVYFGNLWDSDNTATRCPKCRTLLVHRDVYDIKVQKDFDLKNGTCLSCGEAIPGLWS